MAMTLPTADETPATLLATAVLAARAGAEVLARRFRGADLGARAKADHDWVTLADQESEAAILEVVLGRHPDHRILAEEGGETGGPSRFEWLIDPLDGTTNFLHGIPIFAVSIACREPERTVAAVVFDPLRDELFTATAGGGAFWNGVPIAVSPRAQLAGAFLATGFPFRARGALDGYLEVFRDVFAVSGGVRRCGAAALDLAYTAAGLFDGFWELRLSPWDIAAGALLLSEAGGVITDFDGGDEYLAGGNVVGGPPGLQRELLAAVARHLDEAAVDRLVPRPQGALAGVLR